MSGKKKQEKESLATFRRITRYDQMIAAGTYPSVKRLIDEFETSEATVHRDLEALRYDFGADEYLKYDRFKGGYYYTSSTFRIPAQLTTEKQIISAQLMANLLDLIKGTPVYTQAIEVFTTLSSNIEQDTKLNAKKLSNRILFLGMNPVDIEDKTWSLLEEAMSSNHYISFDYEKNGNVYDVTMKPYQLIYFNGMWTLYGYRTNPGFEGNKFFNLPVIKNLRINQNTFELPEDFAYEKHAIGNFGRHIGEETFEFKLQILAPWIAEYAKTYNWAPDQKFVTQKDGSTIMTFTSNQYYPVLDWVLEKGRFIKPLAPKKLVDTWKENAIEMAKMAREMKMKEVNVDEEWLKFNSEKVKNIILKYGGDLFTDLDKEYLRKELTDNYNDILIRIQSKLKETGLPPQIGIGPLLMDFYVSEDINLGYHQNFQVELILDSTGERYSESSFIMSPLDFEKFAYRLIDLNKN